MEARKHWNGTFFQWSNVDSTNTENILHKWRLYLETSSKTEQTHIKEITQEVLQKDKSKGIQEEIQNKKREYMGKSKWMLMSVILIILWGLKYAYPT